MKKQVILAMDKNEILANFQACTGLDDVGQCMDILNQYGWNLQSAVSGSLAQQESGRSYTASEQFHPPPMHERRSPKMITFLCQLGEITKDVTLDDSNTVGDFKEIASIQLGIPLSETQFERWPSSSIANPSDRTVISSLNLPHFNKLIVKVHDSYPDLPGMNPFGFPSTSHNSQPQSPTMSDLTKAFNLVVRNTDNNSQFLMQCEGSKSFAELKQDAIPVTGIKYKQQEWGGFPHDIPPDDHTTIASLHLDEPRHYLTIKSKPVAPPPVPTSVPRPKPRTFGQFKPPPPPSIVTLSSSSDEDDDDFFSDAINDRSHSTPARPARALMPAEVDNVQRALTQFRQEFFLRYGEGPVFVAEELRETVQKAFVRDARKRKLLAVYVHHDKSVQSNVFCSQVLCNNAVSSYLNKHFICWGWDVTSNSNKTRFLNDCSRTMGSGVTGVIRRMNKDDFPVLILSKGKGRTCDVIDIIQGNLASGKLMMKLTKAVEAEEAQTQETDGGVSSEDRDSLRQEQDEAYRMSMEADQAKIRAKEEAAFQQEQTILRQEEDERRKKEEEELQRRRVRRLLNSLPPEPAGDCGKPVSQVRFRAPDGATFKRAFLASEPLQTVIDFVGSKGYSPPQYLVVKSFPKTNLLNLDMSTSLHDHKIFPQESLIIEEDPDYDS